MLRAVDEQPQPAMTLLLGRDGAVLEEQQPLEAIFPLKEETVDLRKAERTRRTSKILAGEETINEEQVDDDENDWGKSKENIHDEETGVFSPIIMRLPEDVQQVLMVAACLGSLDSRLLQASTSSSEDEVSRCLAAAMENGLIKKTQAMHVFSSEDAKKDAYRAIPLRERGRFHVAIGRNLARNLSEDEQEENVSIVLLQFHRGSKDITNNRERKAIVVLCLRGVQWAVSGSDFRSACNYSDLGVLLLGANSWTEEYDLSLALYNDFVEVLYCIANYEKMDAVVSEVLKNAKCFRDTLRVRSTRVFSLCSRYRMAEALKEGLDVLHHLGEAFPAKPRKNHVVVEFMRTRRVLLRTSNEMILRMPLMEDVDKIAAMQMLNLTISTAYHTNPLMMLLMIMRMVQITVRFGLSAVSTVGFAAYSAVFCSISKDKDQGYRYSQLALALLDKFQTREWIPRVYVFVYAEAGPYKCHIAKLCPHLHYAHQVGLETGDMEVSSHLVLLK
jgi:histidine kinase